MGSSLGADGAGLFAFVMTPLESPVWLGQRLLGWNVDTAAMVMWNDHYGTGLALMRTASPEEGSAAYGLNLMPVN
jgi:hypothetical protein